MKTPLFLLLPVAVGALAFALCLETTSTPGGERAAGLSKGTRNEPREAGAAQEAVAEALAAAAGCRDLRDLARLGPLLERLNAAQMAAFLDGLERQTRLREEDLLSPVVAWWTRRDPAAATAWISPRLLRRLARPVLQEESFAAIAAWAKAAPERALQEARAHPAHAFSGMLLGTLLEEWPDASAAARMAVIRDFPAGLGRLEGLEFYLANWMPKVTPQEARDAVTAAATLSAGPERQSVLEAALTTLSDTAPLEALALAGQSGLQDPKAWAALARAAVRQNAPAAAAGLEGAGPEILRAHAHQIASEWAKQDVSAALDWAARHDAISMGSLDPTEDEVSFRMDLYARAAGRTDRLYSTEVFASTKPVIEMALKADPQATMAWVRAQPAGPERDRLVEFAIGAMPKVFSGLEDYVPDSQPRGPRDWAFGALAPLILEMPTADAKSTIRNFTGSLAIWEPTATANWAATLPAGPLRTEAWEVLGAVVRPERKLPLPPAGPDRDAFHAGEVRQQASLWQSQSQPPAEVEQRMFASLTAIADPAVRQRAFDGIFQGATLVPPKTDAAQSPLSTLERAPVPEGWKAGWRAKLGEGAGLGGP